MNTKTENTGDLNFEAMEKVGGGTGLDAQMFLKHLSRKYGVTRLGEIKKCWTEEEHEFFNVAYNRKAGDEPLGPYPD